MAQVPGGVGDYLDGRFVKHNTTNNDYIDSINPATGEKVFRAVTDVRHVGLACTAAQQAQALWSQLSFEERRRHLHSFRDALLSCKEFMAEAISRETGKLLSEARTEVSAVVNRFALVEALAREQYQDRTLKGFPAESLRFHALGVVGVIGPFNFPLHLINAYILPSLIMGNTVVVKPSEVAPLAAQWYAEAADRSSLPPGVFNLVHGGGVHGAALVDNKAVRGLFFTGSYQVGKKIQQAAIDRPELLLALEMGGKNTCVVLNDADLRQAVHEVAIGGYLTTGQRCTGTDRVLVDKNCIGTFVRGLKEVAKELRFGDPKSADSFAGPIANAVGRAQFEKALVAAWEGGAEPVVYRPHEGGGCFANASVHRLPSHTDDIPGYTDVECFGPDLCVQAIEDKDHAIAILNASEYGFANSIFTQSEASFRYFYDRTFCGILNCNRSTNLASPRLPFGGVKKSGNYRPGGAYTLRHTSVPVAVQTNVGRSFAGHAHVVPYLPMPDLEALMLAHSREEKLDCEYQQMEVERPTSLCLPTQGELPQSENYLQRLHSATGLVVGEKKPIVIDHKRSQGPWMCSVDEDPMCVLDAMSQTASHCAGFSADEVVRGFAHGDFSESLFATAEPDGTSVEAQEFASVLRELVPGLPEVAFANSGAEANEIALAVCRSYAKKSGHRNKSRVMAFAGAFHGRTWTVLHTTYNPAKREPFALPDRAATFVPFPVWDCGASDKEEPVAPSGFYAAASQGDWERMAEWAQKEPQGVSLRRELLSLSKVGQELASGEYYACMVEPMQSEGGDRYATARFFRGLRLMTRHYKVPLIFDEVQCGFGLGGTFAWHQRFGLIGTRGEPDGPDVVTFAKRAQCGVVMTSFDLPEPGPAHRASLVRGRLHAQIASNPLHARRIEEMTTPFLQTLRESFPALVSLPRAQGFAMAFDLPTPHHLTAYLRQRFWQGAVVFAAGKKTVRYRLNASFHRRQMDLLFAAIRRSLCWLEAHPGESVPRWHDRTNWTRAEPAEARVPYRIRQATTKESLQRLQEILDIELQIYEPERRTSEGHIHRAVTDEDSIVLLAEVAIDDQGQALADVSQDALERTEHAWQLVGFAIGVPLEFAGSVEGPDRDPMLHAKNTLYSLSITVTAQFQKIGIGRALKQKQLDIAKSVVTQAEDKRYTYVSGRNRIGHTASMTHLNRVFGAHIVCVLTGQYEDPEGQALYYRIPLCPVAPARPAKPALCLVSAGLRQPLAAPPPSFEGLWSAGCLQGPAVNKVTLLNYTTPAVVRASEWFSALLPALPHLVYANSRDEAVDKAVRLARYHRKKATKVIGLEGGYVGHTTGAAMSISDIGVISADTVPPFAWPKVPHPSVSSIEETMAALDRLVAESADSILAFVYEPLQERTGNVLAQEHAHKIVNKLQSLDILCIAVETASAKFRLGAGHFAMDCGWPVPDAVVWWGGGQTSYVYIAKQWYVPKPFLLVSTWDGDELSLIRDHHVSRYLHQLDTSDFVASMKDVSTELRQYGEVTGGQGYLVWKPTSDPKLWATQLLAKGFHVDVLPNGCIPIAPFWDSSAQTLAKFVQAIQELSA